MKQILLLLAFEYYSQNTIYKETVVGGGVFVWEGISTKKNT